MPMIVHNIAEVYMIQYNYCGREWFSKSFDGIQWPFHRHWQKAGATLPSNGGSEKWSHSQIERLQNVVLLVRSVDY